MCDLLVSKSFVICPFIFSKCCCLWTSDVVCVVVFLCLRWRGGNSGRDPFSSGWRLIRTEVSVQMQVQCIKKLNRKLDDEDQKYKGEAVCECMRRFLCVKLHSNSIFYFMLFRSFLIFILFLICILQFNVFYLEWSAYVRLRKLESCAWNGHGMKKG